MDPLEGASRWHRWAVSGTASAISKLLSILDANLPTGWTRLTGHELLQFQTLARKGSAWYAIGTTSSHVGVTLSLERLTESELRGGRVGFVGPPNPTPTPAISASWDHVMRFLDEGIVPAARAAGADVRMPTSAAVFLSELPGDVRDRLRTFSHAARKSLPLTREAADLWRAFVIAAYRAKAIIDARQFSDWLVADGWSRESAAQLDLLFLDHCLLLSRYADEVSAA
jgi:hypothetical protein